MGSSGCPGSKIGHGTRASGDHDPECLAGAKPASNLTEKQRLRVITAILRQRFRFPKWEDLAVIRVLVPGEVSGRPIFGPKSGETIRKLFSPHSAEVKWRSAYAKPFVTWLRTEMGYPNASWSLFEQPARGRADIVDLLNGIHPNSKRSGPRDATPGSNDQQRVAMLLEQATMSSSKHETAYLQRNTNGQSEAERDAAALKRIVVDQRIDPHPSHLHLAGEFRLCNGCGLGCEVYRLFGPALEAVWERRDEIAQSVSSENEFFGLASGGSRIVQGKLQKGDVEGAASDANEIVKWADGGLLGHPMSLPVLQLKARVAEARVAGRDDMSSLETPLLEATEDLAGKTSVDYAARKRCFLCRAVATGAPNIEEKLEESRQALRFVAEHSEDGDPDVEAERLDLAFIEMTLAERLNRDDVMRLGDAMRKPEHLEKVEAIAKSYKSPIRLAKAMWWRWIAGRRNEDAREHLVAAGRLLQQRRSLRHLCVFDVQRFRSEVEEELRRNGLLPYVRAGA